MAFRSLSSRPIIQMNVNDNVNVNVNDNEGEKIKEPYKKPDTSPSLAQRQKEFCKEVARFASKYGKESASSFYIYWSETTRDGTHMRKELEKTWETPKRLALWKSKEAHYAR